MGIYGRDGYNRDIYHRVILGIILGMVKNGDMGIWGYIWEKWIKLEKIRVE